MLAGVIYLVLHSYFHSSVRISSLLSMDTPFIKSHNSTSLNTSLSVDTPLKSHNSTSNTSLSMNTPFKSHNSTSNTFPACEKEMQTPAESEHLRPMDVSKTQFKRVLEAEHVVAYIVQEMDKMGSPVIIMFGTLLN